MRSMPTVSALKEALARQAEQSRSIGERMGRAHSEGLAKEIERTTRLSAESIRAMAERNALPFETRDVLLQMNKQLAQIRLDDARRDAAARIRDWWMLGLTAAILALTAVLVAEIFVH